MVLSKLTYIFHGAAVACKAAHAARSSPSNFIVGAWQVNPCATLDSCPPELPLYCCSFVGSLVCRTRQPTTQAQCWPCAGGVIALPTAATNASCSTHAGTAISCSCPYILSYSCLATVSLREPREKRFFLADAATAASRRAIFCLHWPAAAIKSPFMQIRYQFSDNQELAA